MITLEDRERMLKDIRITLPYDEVKDIRELLLKDLWGRVPYGVIGLIHRVNGGDYNIKIVGGDIDLFSHNFITIKPYLRPMSSMTKGEYEELKSISQYYGFAPYKYIGDWCPNYEMVDWLNKKMFDYRGLIPKGLAIEVTKENNPYKK